MGETRLSQCPACKLAFLGPPPETCPACRHAIASLTGGTASDTDSVVARPSLTPSAPAAAGPRRCAFCGVMLFGTRHCPACGGDALPLEATDEAGAAAALRQARAYPALARPRRSSITAHWTAPPPPWHLRALAGAQRAVFRSPFVVFSVLAHLLAVAFVAQLVFTTVEEKKLLPLYLSFHDRDQGPPGPGDGDDVEEEEPAPLQEEEPEETEEATTPPPQPESEPPTAPIGPRPGPAPASEERTAPRTKGVFSARSGEGKGEALRRFGGSHASEAAVLLGLAWLARHQDASGRWAGKDFVLHCREGDGCRGMGMAPYDVGLTGLALLCYLGAGCTHREGPHAGTVGRALRHLRALQGEDGCFGAKLAHHMYNHLICTLALTECYAMTRDAELRRTACRGLAYLVACQQDGGGWDYTQVRTNRNDVSITGWAVMALKSAHAAGLPFPRAAWRKARSFVRSMTTADGRVRYADRGFVGFEGRVRHGVGMAAVGLLCHLYFGEDPGSPRMVRLADRLLAEPPEETLLRSTRGTQRLHTMYYWYYATLALFHIGGEHWRSWNARTRDFLVARQRTRGCARGSFDPDDGWLGPYGGRLYSTVFSLLNLEVYYRYLPLYASGTAPVGSDEEDGVLAEEDALVVAADPRAKVGERIAAMEALGRAGGERALALLCRLLGDENAVVRWKAAEVLADLGDPAAVPALARALRQDDGTLAPVFVDALASIGSPAALPVLVGCLDSPARRVRRKALRGLREITGEDLGPEPRAWRAWLARRDGGK